ncbi:putative 2-succinyl-6-hydroxy-2,4-cyclohexadiene-1-carboxylate synthase [Gemmatimonadetes bacterium T265]|nr:putative 2-succinyl-6-hydroxy-2,4-cyclohexadiene-1-carboxylate synthase [Gemmatimonadetes bacterium T265]
MSRTDAGDVDVDGGLRLHVDRAAGRPGGAPPVLLLHGFTGSGETWRPLRDALGGAYPTLAVDLPGHGRSGAPADPARYALDRTADDLARVLDACAIDRAAVLGYSFGGRAALRLALRRPERVAALVLESASPGIADPAERAERAAADAALADAIERDGVPAFVDRWERLPLWASQDAMPAAVRARLRGARLANDARGLANSLRGAGTGADAPVLDALGGLRMPALLVAGALDAKYVVLGRAMAGALPGARLAVVPGAGHAVHLEQPDAFAGLVRAFLDETFRREPAPPGA